MGVITAEDRAAVAHRVPSSHGAHSTARHPVKRVAMIQKRLGRGNAHTCGEACGWEIGQFKPKSRKYPRRLPGLAARRVVVLLAVPLNTLKRAWHRVDSDNPTSMDTTAE